jgi:PHD/YefM family antitoxin component YafN of YafNO toxin-antitoxin module
MPDLEAATDVTTVSQLRDHLQDHLDRTSRHNRPLRILEDGEEAFVLLPKGEYARITGLDKSLKQIDASMADIKAGRSRPLEESFAEMRRVLIERCQQRGIPVAPAEARR